MTQLTEELTKAISKLSREQQIALARRVRAEYVNDVRNTAAILKPKLLRQMDSAIAAEGRNPQEG